MNSINFDSGAVTGMHASELLRESNHRICNHLGLVAAMLRVQISGIDHGPERLSREEVKEMLRATAGMLVSVSRLHHRLSEQPHSDKIFLSDYIVEVCGSLVSVLGLSRRVFFVHKWESDCRLSPGQAQYIGLLMNEIMVNALKHAHPTGLPVRLEIRCELRDDGRVAIVIGDDGVGLPDEKMLSAEGVGFGLIRTLTKSLNAELRIESDSLGLTFVVTLPHDVHPEKGLSIVGG
jgi:two-component sensor histidine kinase